MLTSSEKICFKCGGPPQPLSEFYAHPSTADGHLNKCKTCAKKDTKRRYLATAAQQRVYHKELSQSPARRASHVAYCQSHRRRHPERQRARSAVTTALASGKLVKGSCEVCGSTNTQAHHKDYNKPLAITWLCELHHNTTHGKRKDVA